MRKFSANQGEREREGSNAAAGLGFCLSASYCSVAVPVMIFSRNCCSLPTAAKASPQICSGQLIAVLCFWSSKLMPLVSAVHSTQNLIFFFWYCGGVLLCVSLTEVLPPCILLVIVPNMWNVPRSISFSSSSRSGNTGLNISTVYRCSKISRYFTVSILSYTPTFNNVFFFSSLCSSVICFRHFLPKFSGV